MDVPKKINFMLSYRLLEYFQLILHQFDQYFVFLNTFFANYLYCALDLSFDVFREEYFSEGALA